MKNREKGKKKIKRNLSERKVKRRLQHRNQDVRLRDSKLKNGSKLKLKGEKKVNGMQQLREVDLHTEKYSRTGFRVPPGYHRAIKSLGKLMRNDSTYGQDLSESAVVLRLVTDKCRELKVFS